MKRAVLSTLFSALFSLSGLLFAQNYVQQYDELGHDIEHLTFLTDSLRKEREQIQHLAYEEELKNLIGNGLELYAISYCDIYTDTLNFRKSITIKKDEKIILKSLHGRFAKVFYKNKQYYMSLLAIDLVKINEVKKKYNVSMSIPTYTPSTSGATSSSPGSPTIYRGATYTGPRGGTYHYTPSGKKSYYKRKN